MISGFDVVPVRKTADLSPSAVTSTCEKCGKTIGKTRAHSGADLWITEGSGGVLCPNADASISGGHQPGKTASRKTAAQNYVCRNCSETLTRNSKETPVKTFCPGNHGKRHEWEEMTKDRPTQSSLTVTAKEVGYYVVSRNGVPISGPYATRSDAAPNMIEQRGAAVMFIGPGNSAEWEALKAKQFPFGLNTVNGSRKTADGYHNPEEGLDFHESPEERDYIDPRDYEEISDEEEGDPDDIPQRWEASLHEEDDPWATEQHVAGTMADGKTPVRQHKFVENTNWGDESGCMKCGRSKGHTVHTDRSQATAAGESSPLVCLECDKRFKRKVGPGSSPKCPGCGGYDVEPDYERGFPLHGSMQERYSDTRRVASLRHFADEEDEAEGWEKQPKGLTDQVNNGMAPASEIQDPNPLAGQDLERAPRNLAEAARMAEFNPERCTGCGNIIPPGAPSHDEFSCPGNPWAMEDQPHDQLDDPWNQQPSAGEY